jgi:uncharacterized membrane protein
MPPSEHGPVAVSPEPARTAIVYGRVYLCFGVLAVLLFALVTPPYQSPDEPAHFKRADQISRGEWIAKRLDVSASGGTASLGIDQTAEVFNGLPFHPEVRATKQMFTQAASATWANSPSAPMIFSNTALYPPVLYLPSASAILAGKAGDLGIVSTLWLARVTNGIVSVVAGALAIAIAGAAAPWIFAVLSLPMSLSLMASASHDGPMFAAAALAAAIFVNSTSGGPFFASRRAFVALCAAIALVASARPIYAPLAVLPLLVSGQRLALRVAAATAIVAAVGAWAWIVAPLVLLQTSADADPAAQMALLRQDPFNVLVAVARTVKAGFWNLLETFVGRLGWLDTDLPRLYHAFARIELLIAAAVTVAGLTFRQFNWRGLVVATALFGGCLAAYLSLYLVWTRPGSMYVIGVQGRYLTPLILFLPAAVPFALAPFSARIARAGFWALMVLPPVSIAAAMFAIARRYYGWL